MCWMCHQKQSNEEIKRQFSESLKDPKFELWNGTSISHLFLSISGYNGYEISDMALELFENYISWLSEKEPNETENINKLKETYILFFDTMKEKKDNGINEEELRKTITEKMNQI